MPKIVFKFLVNYSNMKPGIFKHRIVQNVTIFDLLASNMTLETKILAICEKYNNLKKC